jgi:dihydropteroate synthase
VEILAPKMRHLNILIKDVTCKTANIIKQVMLSVGGDAAVARGSVACAVPSTDVILMGTEKQIRKFLLHLKPQPFGLSDLSKQLEELLSAYARPASVLLTNRREIILSERTLVMGIINVTPDSFSDGGCYYDPQMAIDRAMELEAEGADLLDIGGESSRPGSDFISVQEELNRVIPVLKAIAGKIHIPISVDTLKAQVAEAVIGEGAEIINDISALTFDSRMASVISARQAAVILMHMQGLPKTMQTNPIVYDDLMGQIIEHLHGQIAMAQLQGIRADAIVVDPGIGFGKTVTHNLRILHSLTELRVLGKPIMTGVSRKSFIGALTQTPDPMARQDGTAAAITASILNGTHIVRVHDVAAARKIAMIAEAIARAGLE